MIRATLRRSRLNRGPLAALGLCASMTLAVAAEPAFVTEGLEVGVHESASTNSAIIALVGSGTVVDILDREGDIARVELDDGTIGWMDASYLTDEPPATAQRDEARNAADALRATVNEQNRELVRARQLLREFEQTLEAQDDRLESAESTAAETRAELEAAQGMLAAAATEHEQAKAAESQLTSDTLRELQRMAQENQRLKQAVAELEAMQAMAAEQLEKAQAQAQPPPEPEPVPSPLVAAMPESRLAPVDVRSLREHYSAILEWATWQWILLGGGLLLSFAVGAYMVDWSVRRRHGGFRV